MSRYGTTAGYLYRYRRIYACQFFPASFRGCCLSHGTRRRSISDYQASFFILQSPVSPRSRTLTPIHSSRGLCRVHHTTRRSRYISEEPHCLICEQCRTCRHCLCTCTEMTDRKRITEDSQRCRRCKWNSCTFMRLMTPKSSRFWAQKCSYRGLTPSLEWWHLFCRGVCKISNLSIIHVSKKRKSAVRLYTREWQKWYSLCMSNEPSHSSVLSA